MLDVIRHVSSEIKYKDIRHRAHFIISEVISLHQLHGVLLKLLVNASAAFALTFRRFEVAHFHNFISRGSISIASQRVNLLAAHYFDNLL